MNLEDCKTIEDLGAFAIHQRDIIKELKKERDGLKRRNEALREAKAYYANESHKAKDERDEIKYKLKQAVDLLIEGKRQFAPNTTNSVVDDFIERSNR